MREGQRVTADQVTRERDHVTRDGKMGRRAGEFQKPFNFSTLKMWRMLRMRKLYTLQVILNKLYDECN